MSRLVQFFNNLFQFKDNHQSDLEIYLSSKKPTTVTELEYWIREYEYQTRKNF